MSEAITFNKDNRNSVTLVHDRLVGRDASSGELICRCSSEETHKLLVLADQLVTRAILNSTRRVGGEGSISVEVAELPGIDYFIHILVPEGENNRSLIMALHELRECLSQLINNIGTVEYLRRCSRYHWDSEQQDLVAVSGGA